MRDLAELTIVANPMEASGLAFGRKGTGGARRWRMRTRPLGLLLLVGAVVGWVAYLVTEVPVAAPLPNGQLLWFAPVATPSVVGYDSSYYWWVALAAAAIVVCVDMVVLSLTAWYRRRLAPPAPAAAAESDSHPASGGSSWPAVLHFDRVPRRVVWITAAASVTLLVAGISQEYALWISVTLGLLPWAPLLAMEAVWKYEHYGLWAVFGVVTLLQVGHLGEHTVQVTQLALHHGLIAQSHGVFGQLDFEWIHFVWDSAIWLFLCMLLPFFSRGNRWLWIAFAAASLHQVEHLYLIYIYKAEPLYYFLGGQEGIMGYNGVIGSPLARPYMHFAYNFLVVIPTVLAFWDQSKRVATGPRRSAPHRVTASAS